MDKSIGNIRKSDWIPIFNSVAWILLSVTFIASGILKGISVNGFALTVRDFLHLLGLEVFQSYALLIAFAICFLEIAIGSLGFIRKLRSALCLVYPIVLLFFTVITYINFTDFYGGIESCGCFGEIIHLGPGETLLKNIGLLAVALYAAFTNHSQRLS